jgi:hypothetical protein
MRKSPIVRLEPFRDLRTSDRSFGNAGRFFIPYNGARLTVVVSDGGGWDHVSVSLCDRCPTWDEMCYMRNLIFRDDEWVMQLHPPKSEYVNNHPYCLHLWRPQRADEVAALEAEYGPQPFPVVLASPIPIPPRVMV